MIIAGYEYRGKKPFTNVYLTGIVRDKQGRKMSKSLGNSPDPIELMEKYGADGVRVGMLLCSPAGNDLPFDESYCEQGRNFSNKIWNAFRLVNGFEVENKLQPETNKIAIEWFDARLNEQLEIINDLYDKYRISEVLMTSYKLMWDDFCAWYLEMIKPDFVDGKSLPIDKATYDATIIFFEKLLKVLHPFIPFITEEIWHLIKERKEKETIVLVAWPMSGKANHDILKDFTIIMEVITNVRNIRKQKNISPKEKLEIFEKDNKKEHITKYDALIMRMCNLSSFNYTNEKIDNSISFIVDKLEFFVPIATNINVGEEKERLLKDIEYNKGFLNSVMKKLSNEKFVANAKPEVLEIEKKKQADAEAKIKTLQEQLAGLN